MIRNVHERTINAPAQALAPLLDGLGGDGDRLWPGEHWVPMVLDRPLAVGADGGHGAIRYRVVEYEPGRRVRFLFHPSTGIAGIHELSVEELGAAGALNWGGAHGRVLPFRRALLSAVLVVGPLSGVVAAYRTRRLKT